MIFFEITTVSQEGFRFMSKRTTIGTDLRVIEKPINTEYPECNKPWSSIGARYEVLEEMLKYHFNVSLSSEEISTILNVIEYGEGEFDRETVIIWFFGIALGKLEISIKSFEEFLWRRAQIEVFMEARQREKDVPGEHTGLTVAEAQEIIKGEHVIFSSYD